MKLMKKSALSLTLIVTLIGLLASCAPNNKKYRNIGCYSMIDIPPTTEFQCETFDDCSEFTKKTQENSGNSNP